jgi:Glycerophosphoryl diester phosphodiesterase
MGNIGAFQENTLDGIRSLIEIKADGVHMHVQLTEDDQLVLFQDSNLYVSIVSVVFVFVISFKQRYKS